MILDINMVFNDDREIEDWENRILARDGLVHFEKNK